MHTSAGDERTTSLPGGSPRSRGLHGTFDASSPEREVIGTQRGNGGRFFLTFAPSHVSPPPHLLVFLLLLLYISPLSSSLFTFFLQPELPPFPYSQTDRPDPPPPSLCASPPPDSFSPSKSLSPLPFVSHAATEARSFFAGTGSPVSPVPHSLGRVALTFHRSRSLPYKKNTKKNTRKNQKSKKKI